MPGGMTHDVALSPRGRTMAALNAGDEASVILVDLDTGTERRVWAGDGVPSTIRAPLIVGYAATAWRDHGRWAEDLAREVRPPLTNTARS